MRFTENVQLPPIARLPPTKLRLLVPVNEEPDPQISLAGRPVATNPLTTASRSSVNRISVSAPPPVLVMENSIVTGSPGATGSSVKDLVNVAEPAVTTKSAIAGSEVPPTPLTVALTSPVVLVYVPGSVATGTVTSTLKLQLLLAGMEPPENNRVEVPDNVPPQPAIGVPVATAPDNIASRLSVKLTALAASVTLALFRVNSNVAVSPASTGEFVKDLASVTSLAADKTSKSSVAGSNMTVVPPKFTDRLLVTLLNVPEIVSEGTCITVLNVQLSPANKLPPININKDPDSIS